MVQFEIFLPSPHCATNCVQHVLSSGQGAIVCKSRAICDCVTWYKGTAQLKFDRVEIALILVLFY